jgi:hypothetical protein
MRLTPPQLTLTLPRSHRWIPFLLRSGQAEVLVAVSTAALPVATIARVCASLIGDRALVKSTLVVGALVELLHR